MASLAAACEAVFWLEEAQAAAGVSSPACAM